MTFLIELLLFFNSMRSMFAALLKLKAGLNLLIKKTLIKIKASVLSCLLIKKNKFTVAFFSIAQSASTKSYSTGLHACTYNRICRQYNIFTITLATGSTI